MLKNSILAALAISLIVSCTNDNSATAEISKPDPAKTDVQDVDKRDNYLKPYDLFNQIGGIGGKKVVDVQAGDGYMSWKMVKAGATVIAICQTKEEYDALIKAKADRGISDGSMEVRLQDISGLGIHDGEADIIMLDEGLSTMPDPVGYGKQLFKGLKRGGMLCNLEWKDKETATALGPPVEERFDIQVLMDLLNECGFTDVASLSKFLPYHNLLLGMEFLGDPGPLLEEPA